MCAATGRGQWCYPWRPVGTGLTLGRITSRLLVWKMQNAKASILDEFHLRTKREKMVWQISQELGNFCHGSPDSSLRSRLNPQACSDEKLMNPQRGLNYTRKQFVIWEPTTRATFISTHPDSVFVFTHYCSHHSLCGHPVLQWKKKEQKWTEQHNHNTFSGASRVHHTVHKVLLRPNDAGKQQLAGEEWIQSISHCRIHIHSITMATFDCDEFFFRSATNPQPSTPGHVAAAVRWIYLSKLVSTVLCPVSLKLFY